MESPLVSIIVPIYNAAMDMVPCLESIKHQRYQNLEVLLVNDGSSDASLEICRMYARLDPRVIIIDKENTGVSGTRNAAIERARGKYLQFVDSDDQLDPNATRLLVEAAEETQADLVICNYCSVMPDGKTTVHGFMQPYTRMDKAQFARCLMEEPASFYYGVMWNKLYRRRSSWRTISAATRNSPGRRICSSTSPTSATPTASTPSAPRCIIIPATVSTP